MLGTPPAFVLSQDQTLHSSLLTRFVANLAIGLFQLTGLIFMSPHIGVLACIVQFSKNRAPCSDFQYTTMFNRACQDISRELFALFSPALDEKRTSTLYIDALYSRKYIVIVRR